MEIHKYKLNACGENIVNMPQGAKILCVQKQGYDYCLWAEVDAGASRVNRCIVAYCTGERFSYAPTRVYVSTVQLGGFVVHFYDLGEC